MLELEVGISGFEGCVSFLGFPPRKPSWLRKPRTPRDARVTMPCACGDHRVANIVLYLEEDTATLLVGHKVHPRNTLSDHYIAELLMFVGRPLRAEARQSCYESQSRTIH